MNNILERMYRWDEVRTRIGVNYEREKWLKEEVAEWTAALYNIQRISASHITAPLYKAQPLHHQASSVANYIKESFDIMKIAMGGLYELGLNMEDIVKLFSMVCDSNDTRPKYKLQPGEKGTKGKDFVPAELAMIEYIIKERL